MYFRTIIAVFAVAAVAAPVEKREGLGYSYKDFEAAPVEKREGLGCSYRDVQFIRAHS